MISEPMVRSVQTVHVSLVKISSVSKQTKTSLHHHHHDDSIVSYMFSLPYSSDSILNFQNSNRLLTIFNV
jgi:hypothetical protein